VIRRRRAPLGVWSRRSGHGRRVRGGRATRAHRRPPEYDEVLVNADECAEAVRMLWTADLSGSPELVVIIFNQVIRPLLARPNGPEQMLMSILRVVRFLTVMAAAGHGTSPGEIVQNVALIELSGGVVLDDDETEDDADVD